MSDETCVIAWPKSFNPVEVPTNRLPPDGAVAVLALILERHNGNKLSFDFERAIRIPLAAINELPDALKNVATWNENKFHPVRAYHPTHGPKEPSRRGKKKLSINVYEKVILAIRLSVNEDWQFPKDAAPFSLGAGADLNNFSDASKVSADGTNINASGDDGCRVAYMTVLGDESNYEAQFNINIELLVDGNDGNRHKIPLIIDPDVRWPNGTNP